MIRSTARLLRPALVLAATLAIAMSSGAAASAPAVSPEGGTGSAAVPTDPQAGAVAPAVVDPGAVTSAQIRLEKVTGGLSSPVYVADPKDGSGRLFIVEKTGTVRIYANGALLPTVFLSVARSVSHGDEQGLLGLAFHPSFSSNHKLYVDYTDVHGNTVVREYRASASDPNRVETGSGRTIIEIDQPYANHNGGMLAFGPDGYLYIGMGDGGSAGDPGNRAQSVSSRLGKILRINVNGSTATRNYVNPSTNPWVGKPGYDEIWERGLRNPWRFSFDRANGNLWIGDVGQARYEEIDRATRTSNGPGRGANWGWRVMEGFYCYNPSSNCNKTGKIKPVLDYSHAANGRCAVTGGYVYRGSAIPALVGGYLYADFCSGEIFVVSATAAPPASVTRLLDTSLLISSFGEDAAGELYVCDLNGNVYRIVAA